MTLGDRATASFGAALLPEECGGPSPAQLAQRVDRYLRRLPTPSRVATRAGLLSLAAASYLTTGRSMSRLTPQEREAVLRRIAGLSPEAGAAMEGLKAVVLLANGAETYAAELLERAQKHEPARPDAELNLTSSVDSPSVVRADAVVVGSGAGGAMAARTLARAGMDTVVLEEGRRWTVEEFRSRHPLERYAGLYRGAGATVALGRPAVVLPIGRAVGGTTVVNSGTCYRPPLAVQQRWRDEFGLALADPDRLVGHLDDVAETLQVAPVPLDIMGRNGRLLLEGAAALGWQAAPIPRNAPGCEGCCQCALGCPRNAKFGVHLNALPQACAAGARIISNARVERVLHTGGRAYGVRARRPDGTAVDVLADTVVIAAGATETPGLLRRSGLGRHPRLGRNLALHPAAMLAGRFEEDIVAWHGVLQSAAVDELHASHGVLIEATSTPPGMGSMLYPGFGTELLSWLDRATHVATFGAMVADSGVGRVFSVGGQTLMRYDLARADATKLMTALEAMGRLLFAAGAVELLTGLPGANTVASLPELQEVLARTNPRSLHLAAFHPTGTAAAGVDEQRCPVDETGRLRGVDRLWVTDASILPSCPEVNPQVSIMALALAVADGIVS
ncbi:GMC family oxidoreductase N-terminal domain-containing protein [Mycobacterium shimoidei]|uniref:GMC family oxidoreductase N-terminal domain-containing protein n=1 Tax=Mycobacterium shimoidei TaxID=29313 RepID=UPI0008493588|nr:GMC family oxidoreductase N-terminal domain-containing protein [Mycobacterium shimoidei]MCV7260412.1 GMC family oxidoreductase N-terminal domain-containing protein [Mycobacterium shimoidei]ODR11307.1 oxidoreductase [Mycobacterium shimoidei]ORW78143.1 oxidoreductase [Mycobacterium shimoidei]